VISLLRPKGAIGARETDETHRVSTPLELLFDLCFVVAVGQAGQELAHAIGRDQVGHGLISYAAVFFAVWWPWMNYSWFATAFDPDDIPFRLATFAQIAGALVIAAGVPRAFEHRDYTVAVIGYVVVRLAFASQWIRVYRDNPELRGLAARWGGGVLGVQVLWVALQWVHSTSVYELCFGGLFVVELLVPYWAGRAGKLPFHPHHISERYGLFTLIVLGETVSAATIAIQEAMNEHDDVRRTGAARDRRPADRLRGLVDLLRARGRRPAGRNSPRRSSGATGTTWCSPRPPRSGPAPRWPPRGPPGASDPGLARGRLRHRADGGLPADDLGVAGAALQEQPAAQAVMPATAAAVLLCTVAGTYAVFLAGLCCVLAVICGLYAQRLGSADEGTEPAAEE
jgi:hypothetical protein